MSNASHRPRAGSARGPVRPPDQVQRGPATGAFGTTRSTDEPRPLQHARAQEPARGRQATAPWQIPWKGWKDILWRTYQQLNEDRLLAVAAGVVFYGLLALFPGITALVSLYGLFAKPSTISEHMSVMAGLLPSGGFDIFQEQVSRLTAKGDAKLSFGFIFGLLVALWSANAGMKALMDALNVVYEEKEKRGFIKLNLVSLCFTLAAIAAVLLVNRRGGGLASRAQLCRPGQPGCDTAERRALAADAGADHHGAGLTLSLRPEPPRAALAMAERGERVCCGRMARQLRIAVLVPGELRQL
jgi:hypothetical protein